MHPANFARSQQGSAVAVSDLPLVAMLKTRMHWHQTRQKLLAENVSNADTPGFQPKDLKAPAFAAGRDGGGDRRRDRADRSETHCRPRSAEGRGSDRGAPFRDDPERQCGEPRGRDAEGLAEPVRLPARRLALPEEPADAAHRGRQALRAMDFLRTISVAASGLKAQSGRMRVIAENIANADSTAERARRGPLSPQGREPSRAISTGTSRPASSALGRIRPDQSAVPHEVRSRPPRRRRQGRGQAAEREHASSRPWTCARRSAATRRTSTSITATRRMISRTLEILRV